LYKKQEAYVVATLAFHGQAKATDSLYY